MRKRTMLLLGLLIYGFCNIKCEIAFAESLSAEKAQSKAEQLHKIASSDSIYADEELKALYYQNIQIIELLKDIRQLLKEQLEARE